jgi:hypothetical protein
MGSLSSITSLLSPVLTGAGLPVALVGAGSQILQDKRARSDLRAQQNVALDQLQSRQRLEEGQSAQNATLEKQKIAADATAAEERRKLALRRTVARQKTLFSAQGLGGNTAGSNEAVLLGLYNDSDMDASQQNQSDYFRKTALDQSLAQQRQKNLLEASQLSERQNLTRIIQRG